MIQQAEIQANFKAVQQHIPPTVTLVAVSKTHPTEAVQAVYDLGHRAFGENKVQELLQKKEQLPADIQWHLIGHLQTNKVRQVLPHVHLIHSVDSEKLLHTIHKESERIGQKTNILLQVHIAQEETKFGWDAAELTEFLAHNAPQNFPWINICGLMGMASFTSDTHQIAREFTGLRQLCNALKPDMPDTFTEISMGMSGDYQLAIAHGSTMVRIGSTIFGSRHYPTV